MKWDEIEENKIYTITLPEETELDGEDYEMDVFVISKYLDHMFVYLISEVTHIKKPKEQIIEHLTTLTYDQVKEGDWDDNLISDEYIVYYYEKNTEVYNDYVGIINFKILKSQE